MNTYNHTPKRSQKSQIAFLLLVACAFIFVATFVSAESYELYCLQHGETLDLPKLCNPAMQKKSGPIFICMHNLDNGKICPTIINVCNSLGLKCKPQNSSSIDQDPPVFTFTTPKNNSVIPSRSTTVAFTLSEKATVMVMDNNDVRHGWKQVCQGCTLYNKQVSFVEGINDLTYRAKDNAGNMGFYSVVFFIDSIAPKIDSTTPEDGFASGKFGVDFTEANLKTVMLNYGNAAKGMKQQAATIGTCTTLKGKTHCETTVNLATYDGQEIQYWFEVTDISNKKVSSKQLSLKVDSTAPKVTNVLLTIDKSKVMIKTLVTESFFKSVEYKDITDPKGKWTTLCTTLVSGACEKQVTFSDGPHTLIVQATDQAGSTNNASKEFFIDSKVPKITKTEPTKGFASGLFAVEFQEANPKVLLLNYGNAAKGVKQQSIPMGQCVYNAQKKTFRCQTTVDVKLYDGQTIDYWFVLTDIVNNTATSKHTSLQVDTSFPLIKSSSVVRNGNTGLVTLNITEQNLAVVSYINHNDTNPIEKKLCVKLNAGACQGSIKLAAGQNIVDLHVSDLAGNMVAQQLKIA